MADTGGRPLNNAEPGMPGDVARPARGIIPSQNIQSVNAATAPSTQPAPAAAAPAAPAAATTTGPTDAQNASVATASISSTLSGLGLGAMVGWATNLVSTLAGQGIDSSDIVNTVIGQLNNPTTNGQTDQTALNAFNTALPGFNQLIQNTGNNGSPGSTPAQAIANYINYSTQIQQFEQQALIPGPITPQTIGNLWAGQVSTAEVSQRITDATVAASSAPQAVQDYMSQNFLNGGSPTSALASYYLNPTNTLQTITQAMNTSTVGGEAAISGFSQNLSVAQSQALGAFLANGTSGGSSSAIGQVNQITAGQANNAFSANLGGGVTGSAAQLAALEQAGPGGNAGGQVSENELLSAIGVPGQGTTQAQALIGVSNAQQTRTAGARGGGGAAATSGGAVGLGFSNQGG